MNLNKSILTIIIMLFSFLSYSQIDGNKVKMLSAKIEVSLPDNFYRMTQEAIDIKYPYNSNKPQEVYTDKLGEINFTASLRENLPTEERHLPEVKKVLLKNIKTRGVSIVSDKFIKINNKVYILIEFISQGLDKKIYNMLYASNLNGKLLIGNFNFPNNEYDKKYNEAKYALNTLKIL